MRPPARTLVASAVAAVLAATSVGASAAFLSAGRAGLTFAVIGDNGSGQPPQFEVARQMVKSHASTPFELVLMMGDNMYGSQKPRDFAGKFEIPYGPLLRMGIPFHAALGNHDEPNNRNYPGFNMGGQRYYSMARGTVRFVFLDTNFMDPAQVKWFDAVLAVSSEPWKVVVFHHPIYSDGNRHGANVELRVILEPLMIKHGVAVVFSGHEHIYERIKPQKGITYFIVGSSGQLRKGGVTPSAQTAASFADDRLFDCDYRR
jgi:Calcineurin-like phosphoesterase